MSGMSTSELEEINTKNLASLQRIDPCATRILERGTHSALYTFDMAKKSWEKTEVSGSMFIYKRCDHPIYSLVIVNRQSLSDFVEPIKQTTCVNCDKNFLFLKKSEGEIRCFWFHKVDECARIASVIEKLIAALKDAGEGSPVNPAAEAPAAVDPQSSNLLDLLKGVNSAKKDTSAVKKEDGSEQKLRPSSMVLSEADKSDKLQSPSAASVQNIANLPVLLQKLMVQEQPKLVTKAQVQMLSADELEKDLVKDLAKTAKPKQSFSEFLNSSSAASIDAMSTRSVHGSEIDHDPNEVDVDSALSVRQNMDDVSRTGSGTNTPSLSKEQFLSALTHLLDTDDVFVSQIHQAYVDALNRRLNLS